MDIDVSDSDLEAREAIPFNSDGLPSTACQWRLETYDVRSDAPKRRRLRRSV